MNILSNGTYCTGCGACSAICPVQAISMRQDDEDGFYRPFVKENLCIKCDTCKSICPQLHENAEKKAYFRKVYASKNRDEETRNAAASGGLFAAFANEILRRGGCVAGVAYDEQQKVVHKLVENTEELRLLFGAKYAQSDTSFVYNDIYQKLEAGKEVLFCGTPCQVAGIKKFAQAHKMEEKLITIDLLCSGVPSPKAFEKYIELIENKYRKKVAHIKFEGHENGWHHMNTRITWEDNSELFLPKDQCSYLCSFLDKNVSVGDFCSHCSYKTTQRPGDITLGDFWGLKNTELADGKGTSAVIINSEKGMKLWDVVNRTLFYKESTVWRVVKGNQKAFVNLPADPIRKHFWGYLKQYDFDKALEMTNHDFDNFDTCKNLGKSFNLKKLGFGSARLPVLDPNDNSKIDIDLTRRMVDAFLERGFTYFDTAWTYHRSQSEKVLKEVLVDRYPRNCFALADKLPPRIKSKEDRDQIFCRQLEKTGVDFFDYYLLHNVGTYHYYEVFQKYDCFSWLVEKKKQGLVKNIGFSFHDNAELLEQVLTDHPEMEFVQLQVNYLDWNNEIFQVAKCCDVAKKHNVPVIVMEPVKGGTLANVPKEVEALFKSYHPDASPASWAIRYAASLDNVIMVLSGMSNMDQLLDNTEHMANFKPLNEEERKILDKAVDMINSSIAIPCTGCDYCTENCPEHIAIPKYFSLYNSFKQESGQGWTPYKIYYNNLTKIFGKASACVECRQCEKICPQHLPVTQLLKEVANCFEE